MTKTFLSAALVAGALLTQVSIAAVPTLAMTFDTNVTPIGTTSSQEAKIQAAENKIKDVVGSEEFRTAVLNHTYNGKKTFVDNGGLSNAQIYKAIIEGSEKLRPGIDNAMDLKLEVFNRQDTTVGYTFPNVIRVWMNSKFLNKYQAANVTTNMMHEWLHKIGFDHAVNYTPARDHSVPYAIGYIVKRLAKQYVLQGYLD